MHKHTEQVGLAVPILMDTAFETLLTDIEYRKANAAVSSGCRPQRLLLTPTHVVPRVLASVRGLRVLCMRWVAGARSSRQIPVLAQ